MHAAMGDVIAARLLAAGLQVSHDEPFQHFQFAGRADLLAWDADRTALLHVENRTRFPNIGETFGSYNAKRRYMPSVIAERLGLRGGFRVVTNVIVALWSSDVLHVVRRHRPSFSAVCPHGPGQFAAWWSGQPPAVGDVSSSIILFDPVGGGRADRRRFIGLEEVPTVRPRYRGYADAVEALRRESQSHSTLTEQESADRGPDVPAARHSSVPPSASRTSHGLEIDRRGRRSPGAARLGRSCSVWPEIHPDGR